MARACPGSSGWGGTSKRQRAKALVQTILNAIPWIICITIIALGIPLWYMNSGLANARLADVLSHVSQLVPADNISSIVGAVESVRRGGLIGLIVISVAVAIGAAAHITQQLPGKHSNGALKSQLPRHSCSCTCSLVSWPVVEQLTAAVCIQSRITVPLGQLNFEPVVQGSIRG